MTIFVVYYRPSMRFRLTYCTDYNEVHGDPPMPYSSVGSVQDLSSGGCWFDPRLGQFSVRVLMTVIATRLIFLSPLSSVSSKVFWEVSQRLGKIYIRILCGTLVKRTATKHE